MWSISAWERVEPIYERIIKHPFITELADGTLGADRFKFYIEQDVIYLSQLSESISKLALRLTDTKYRALFEKFAVETMQMEQSMQVEYAADFVVKEDSGKTLACIEYMGYEAHNAESEDVAVALASMLPCYWIYKCVGDYVSQSANLEGNTYAGWIALYSDEYFVEEVEQFIAICDKYAEESSAEIKEKMVDAFLKSAQYEYDFWNDAYNMSVYEI